MTCYFNNANLWQEMKGKWLSPLECIMVGYREYEDMARGYMRYGAPSLSELMDYGDSLVKMGASPEKLGDIYLRVSKERMDVV